MYRLAHTKNVNIILVEKPLGKHHLKTDEEE
jgi:hypothetical protein